MSDNNTDKLQGVYVGKEEKPGNKGPTYKYKFQTPNAQSPAIINSKIELIDPKLEMNKNYEVAYTTSDFTFTDKDTGKPKTVPMKWLFAVREIGTSGAAVEQKPEPSVTPPTATPSAPPAHAEPPSNPNATAQSIGAANVKLNQLLEDMAKIKNHLGIDAGQQPTSYPPRTQPPLNPSVEHVNESSDEATPEAITQAFGVEDDQ